MRSASTVASASRTMWPARRANRKTSRATPLLRRRNACPSVLASSLAPFSPFFVAVGFVGFVSFRFGIHRHQIVARRERTPAKAVLQKNLRAGHGRKTVFEATRCPHVSAHQPV